MIDPALRRWFEAGQIDQALLGRNEYFIPSPLYGDHHLGFVVGELLKWARSGNRQQEQSATGFRSALHSLVSQGDAQDAYQLVWALLVVEEEEGAALNVDADDMARELRAVDQHEQVDSVDESFARLRSLVWDRLRARKM